MIHLAFLLALVHRQAAPTDFLSAANQALQRNSAESVTGLFANPTVDAPYVLAMAQRRGGLSKLHAAMIPTPPGWDGRGTYWMIFHTPQDIEEDHDPVFEVISGSDGFHLGHEVREDDLGGWHIQHQDFKAVVRATDHAVDLSTTLTLTKGSAPRAPVFRVNDFYSFTGKNVIQADETTIPQPKTGSLVRAGSMLIPWSAAPTTKYTFSYTGVLDKVPEDKITPDAAYITAWCLPSLGRLPFTTHATVVAPDVWTVRSEGVQESRINGNGTQTISFKCDLPISYPKVIAGLYKLAGEKAVNGQTFRVFQLDPIDQDRADRDLKAMVDAAAFFQSNFGPLPFPGYECYDADTYYGIESYSHTLLRRNITHYASHEMGHSFFGGLAPCPYVNDSWNEGLTQYIDSVLFLGNKDKTLEGALNTISEATPLSSMPEAHAYRGASYWRGAYVMKMLETEIGPDKVITALHDIAQTRQGKDTRWRDLRAYFEKAGGKDLGWFWDQWVDNGVFPTLKISNVEAIQRNGAYRTFVRVKQSGTAQPFKLRFKILFDVQGQKTEKLVELDQAQDEFSFDSAITPTNVRLEIFTYTLARVETTPTTQTPTRSR